MVLWNNKKLEKQFSLGQFKEETLGFYILAFLLLWAFMGVFDLGLTLLGLGLDASNADSESDILGIIGGVIFNFILSISILVWGVLYSIGKNGGTANMFTQKLFVFGWFALLRIALVAIPVRIIALVFEAKDIDILPTMLELGLEVYFFILVGRMMQQSKTEVTDD